MILITLLFIIFTTYIYFWFSEKKQKKLVSKYLSEFKVELDSTSIINMNSLEGASLFRNFKEFIDNKVNIIGFDSIRTYIILMAVSYLAVYLFQEFILKEVNVYLMLFVPLLIVLFVLSKILEKRRVEFEEEFPDALNLIANAVTSGDSIVNAIQYAGETIHGRVGKEFKSMAERMKLGEPLENIFKRSCKVLPYPSFIFFIVVLKSNIDKGGQIKGILKTLVSVITTSRIVYKKKLAMTSEARISAKIVSAIPAIFLGYMYVFSKANLDYVLHDPRGHYVLYYVLGSEFLGLAITWWLIKGVE